MELYSNTKDLMQIFGQGKNTVGSRVNEILSEIQKGYYKPEYMGMATVIKHGRPCKTYVLTDVYMHYEGHRDALLDPTARKRVPRYKWRG